MIDIRRVVYLQDKMNAQLDALLADIDFDIDGCPPSKEDKEEYFSRLSDIKDTHQDIMNVVKLGFKK